VECLGIHHRFSQQPMAHRNFPNILLAVVLLAQYSSESERDRVAALRPFTVGDNFKAGWVLVGGLSLNGSGLRHLRVVLESLYCGNFESPKFHSVRLPCLISCARLQPAIYLLVHHLLLVCEMTASIGLGHTCW